MTPAQAVKTQKQKNNQKSGKDANAFLNLMASNSLCNTIVSKQCLLTLNENKQVNTGLLDQWALFDPKEQSIGDKKLFSVLQNFAQNECERQY